jgi:hypothetical protein
VLPAILFPTLSILGAKYIFANMTHSSLPSGLGAACAPGLPIARAYTGSGSLDAVLCRLVAFFQAALEPESETYTTWLLAALAPIGLFTFVESARSGRSWILASPIAAATGVAYQRFTGGVVLPIFWALFIITGSPLKRGTVNKRYARALAVAATVGYVVPSFMMVGHRTAGWVALWQGFPLWILLVEHVALLPISVFTSPESGTQVVRTIYMAAAVAAAIVHTAILFPNIGRPAALMKTFVPHVVGPEFRETGVVEGALNFLQWDGWFIAVPAQLASLWFGRNANEVLVLAIWNLLGGFVVGPGAVLASVYAWREGIVGA